jgi:hypothetical protein
MAFGGAAALMRSKLPRADVPSIDVDGNVPDTPSARHARAVLVETSPPWLVHHGHRTFAWATALAARDGLRPDRELLYCAALLHDLGITERYLAKPGQCFALTGAADARAELRAAGMSDSRARVVAEAIALHLNVVVSVRAHGPEAHLLRAATALDVAGQDIHRIHRAFREATLSEFPRLDMKERLVPVIGQQATASPRTRIGFLCREMGLLKRVQTAPFAS